ncbi:MAG: hypothetical protein IKB82_05855, partial [Clostridia bacterium]|nr:hypothetical protein [Clostridia bacterium]
TITIRKYSPSRLTFEDFIELGTMTEEMAEFLRICGSSTLARHKRPLGVCAYHTGRAKHHDLKSPGKPVDVWSLLYNQVYRTRLLLCYL